MKVFALFALLMLLVSAPAPAQVGNGALKGVMMAGEHRKTSKATELVGTWLKHRSEIQNGRSLQVTDTLLLRPDSTALWVDGTGARKDTHWQYANDTIALSNNFGPNQMGPGAFKVELKKTADSSEVQLELIAIVGHGDPRYVGAYIRANTPKQSP